MTCNVSVRKFDAFASKWRRTRRKMKELYSKNNEIGVDIEVQKRKKRS